MLKKSILIFSIGIITGSLFFLILLYFTNLIVISENETVIGTIIDVLATVLTTVLSAFVAFMVAYFQIQKEKRYQTEKTYEKNLRYLKILLYENEINKYNVNKAIDVKDKIDPQMLYSTLDNIISMDSWAKIYLEIEISKECYDKISNLHRELRKVRGIPKENFKVTHLKNLEEPLNRTINVIELDIQKLEKKLNILK